MKVKNLSALAGLGGALIMCGESQAAYSGLSVHAHTTVNAGGFARQVYRVYANFNAGNDLVFGWSGPTTDPIFIQSLTADGTGPGGNFFNPGGASGNLAPTNEQINGGTTPNGNPIPPVANIAFGTFATVGVSVAEQGSGPTVDFPNLDQTNLSPGFPQFIVGNSFSSAGSVFAVPQVGPNSQGRADYAGDGDGALRVLLMQLTVNLGENVAGNIDVQIQLGGSGQTTTVEDQVFNSVPAPGALALLGLAGLVGSRRRRA